MADVKAEILYGFHPVYEALRAGRRTFHEIYFSKQTQARRIDRIRSAASRKNILLKEASPAKLQSIGGNVPHQGVMARVSAYPLADTADLLETVSCGARSPFFLLLDQIVDPHNLGAIIAPHTRRRPYPGYLRAPWSICAWRRSIIWCALPKCSKTRMCGSWAWIKTPGSLFILRI